MGKGDKKSRKGKIKMASFGVSRPRDKKPSITVSTEKKVKAEKVEAPKKVAAKKEAAPNPKNRSKTKRMISQRIDEPFFGTYCKVC
jgi:ribosomal small subunit protein bTHX